MLHNQDLKSKGNNRKLSRGSYLKTCTLVLSVFDFANLVCLLFILQLEVAFGRNWMLDKYSAQTKRKAPVSLPSLSIDETLSSPPSCE